MASTIDSTTIEVPVVLRDLLARHRLHPRQAYHEVIEAAVDYWLDNGGWGPLANMEWRGSGLGVGAGRCSTALGVTMSGVPGSSGHCRLEP